MKKKSLLLGTILSIMFMSFSSINTYAMELELASLLMNKLGITSPQAMGGVGSIFSKAQNNLEPNQFSTIAKAVPDMDSYLEATPQKTGASGLLEAGASMLGDDSSISDLASLASSFSSLGMDSDIMNNFIPIVLDYVKQKGGEAAMGLLKTAIGL